MRNGNHWVGGNRIELLENGEAFFPRVFDAIRQAQREVIIETFILFEDRSAWNCMPRCARRRSAAPRST